MRYKNVRTQAVIETACVIRGGDWVLVDKQPATISELVSESASESESASTKTRKKK